MLPIFTEKYYDQITNNLSKRTSAIRLSNACYIGPIENPSQNDFYNTNLENIFDISSLYQNENIIDVNGNIHMPKCMIDDAAVTLKFDKSIIQDNNQRSFIFANIKSDTDENIVIRLGGGGVFKVWLNGKCVFYGWAEGIDRDLIMAAIHKGNNSIIVELEVINENNSLFSAQVCKFEEQITSPEYPILRSYLKKNVENNFALVDETCHVSLHKIYRFMVRKKDFISKIDSKLKLQIKSSDGIIEEFYCDFDKVYEIDCNRLRQKITGAYAIICLTLIDNGYTLVENNYPLFIREIDEYKSYVKNAVLASKGDALLNEYIMKMTGDLNNCITELTINPQTFINDSTKRIRENFIVNQIESINRCIEVMNNGGDLKSILYMEGIHDIYFNSFIDNTIKKMVIHIPKNYDYNYKYPLVVLILANNTNYMSESESNCLVYKNNINNLVNEPCIIAFIPIRGFTMGSYIGDTAFFEALDLIKSKYEIDEDRIYLAGNSNGAYATWAIAQNHPDVFAAIFTDGGCPNKDNLMNINHIPIMNIVGENDKIIDNAYVSPTQYFKEKNSQYQSCLVKAGNHYTANAYFYKNIGYYINWLLNFRRTRLPQKLEFRTERLVYNKSYYLEILEIADGARFSEIKSDIINQEIRINTLNVSAFCLDLSYLDRNIVSEIYVNEKKFPLCNQSKIIFEKENDQFKKCTNFTKKHYRQGMGFLYIYIDNFKVVLPKYCSEEASLILRGIADTFSKPASNAVRRKIDVEYAVMYDDEYSDSNSNVLLIDYALSNQLLNGLLDKLPIQLHKNGILYKNQELHGEYSIICICSIGHTEVAIISSNNLTHLNTNFFLRNFIIPSYYNGFHKFLNNDAIIYYNQHYYTIYNWGDDMIESL